MISNSNQTRKLLAKMSVKEQQDFIGKIKETLDNLIQWVNDFLKLYKSNSDEAKALREYKHQLKKISKMWDEMLESAITANQALQKEGKSETEVVGKISNDVQYSSREKFDKTCEKIKTISDEEYKEALKNHPFILVMNYTPQTVIDAMKEINPDLAVPANNRRILMRRDALYLAIRGEGIQEGHYHDLGAEALKKLPEYLERPDAIIRTDGNKKRCLVLSHIEVKNGQAIISVEFESSKDYEGKNEFFNVIITVFDLHENYIKKLFRKNNAEIKYEKEDLEQVNPQLYKWLRTFNSKSSKDSILNPDEKVKKNFDNDEMQMSDRIDRRRKSYYNEYHTNALIWARSASTKPGDLKILNANGKHFALIEATEDGFVELKKGRYEEVRTYYERAYRKATDEIYGNTQGIKADQGRDIWDMQYAGDRGNDVGDGEQTGSKGLQTDTSRDNEHLRKSDKGESEEPGIEDSGDVQFSDRDDFYTEQEYSDFGWARANGILNAGQNADYRSKFAMAKGGRLKFNKSKNGEYIIPVSDIYDATFEGINNILVFAKGTIDKPVITSIIEIYEYDETSLDKVRRNIYELERRGIQQKAGGVIGRYYATDFGIQHYREYLESSRNNNGDQFGERNSEETSTSEENRKGIDFYSDRDDVSVYEQMGETERLVKENEKFKTDIERLKERLKLERQITHGNYFNENQLDIVAGHLRKIAGSTYSKAKLVELLREVYSFIAHTEDISWDEVFVQCYDVAESILSESKPKVETDDYAKHILREIRSKRISLSETQIAEAKRRFGNNYRDSFMGKILITKDGISLDSQWQEWASQYPAFFDAEIGDISKKKLHCLSNKPLCCF